MASASLRSTLTSAAREHVQFSSAERALFTACEFWAAVCSRTLASHLALSPLDALRSAGIVYAAIGANEVVVDVIAAIVELKLASQPQVQHQCVTKLQERLLGTRDPVDQLIARLAETLSFGSESGAKHVFEPIETALPDRA